MLWREENPFTGRFQESLSPQGDNDLNMLYVNVDGFRQAAPDIEKWSIAATGQRTKPYVALIFGPSGSGRSSTAKYVGYRCAAAMNGNARPGEKHDLLCKYFVEFVVADEHPVVPTGSLISNFFNRVIDQNIQLPQSIIDMVLRISIEGPPTYLSNLYSLIRPNTKGGIQVPIFCLERVRKFEQISVAVQALRMDAILICTTSLQTVASDFMKANKEFNSLQLKLTGLQPHDVVELFKQRWREFASNPKDALPIDVNVIENTFVHNWPIKGVILKTAVGVDLRC